MTTESGTFKAIVFIASGFTAGFTLANIIYYAQLRSKKGSGGCDCIPLTKTQITGMLVLNGILFTVALIVFFWALYVLLFHRTLRTNIESRVASGIFVPATPTSTRPAVATVIN